jgi:hypothetical protein
MRGRKLALLACGVLLFLTPRPSASTPLFPTISVGDTFSGTFSIDPTTPTNSNSDNIATFFYTFPSQIGTLTFNIDGGTLTAPIAFVTVELNQPTRTGPISAWQLAVSGFVNPGTGPEPGSFNGVPLLASTVALSLPGNNNSTSILPLPLSSYTPVDLMPPFNGPNLQFQATSMERV